MERHRGDAEAEPGHDHDDCDLGHPRQGVRPGPGQRLRQRRQVRCAGHAIEIAEAEEQEGRRKNAEQEVLHRRFLALRRPPWEIEDHISGNTDELQGQEERDQVVCRARQAQARHQEEETGMKLRSLTVRHLVPATQDQHGPADERDDLDPQG